MRVGGVVDVEEDNIGIDEVVEGVGVGVDVGLGFGGVGEFVEDLVDLGFYFGEGGFGLFVVDGGVEYEIWEIVD